MRSYTSIAGAIIALGTTDWSYLRTYLARFISKATASSYNFIMLA